MAARTARPVTLQRWLKTVGIAVLLLAGAGSGAFASSVIQEPDAAEPQEQEENSSKPPRREVEEEDDADVAPDAMRDPLIAKVIHRRVLIDKPHFSMETGGKVQLQYYDTDSADPDNEDKLFLRRIRPFLMGHFATHWKWKAELERSAQITAFDFGSSSLDFRDLFVRYEGFERAGTRLTIGNQKAPFSREFMRPSTSLLFVERTAVGLNDSGVPDRLLGVHVRRPFASDKAALWASVGSESLEQDVRSLWFRPTLGADNEFNRGWLGAGRLDFQPAGPRHSDKNLHLEMSFAGYYWENDGSRNTFTQEGVALDPLRADVNTASGLELSGVLDAGGFTLGFQHNWIEATSVADDFTGGIYLAGDADAKTSTLQSAYRIARRRVQSAAGATRFDVQTYVEPWTEWILGFNLDLQERYLAKLQITTRWISSRFGLPGEDFVETRLQVQYVW